MFVYTTQFDETNSLLLHGVLFAKETRDVKQNILVRQKFLIDKSLRKTLLKIFARHWLQINLVLNDGRQQ